MPQPMVDPCFPVQPTPWLDSIRFYYNLKCQNQPFVYTLSSVSIPTSFAWNPMWFPTIRTTQNIRPVSAWPLVYDKPSFAWTKIKTPTGCVKLSFRSVILIVLPLLVNSIILDQPKGWDLHYKTLPVNSSDLWSALSLSVRFSGIE